MRRRRREGAVGEAWLGDRDKRKGERGEGGERGMRKKQKEKKRTSRYLFILEHGRDVLQGKREVFHRRIPLQTEIEGAEAVQA